jgi:hypothetical protein
MTMRTLECVLDDRPVPVDSALKTWGQLLGAVDRSLAATRRAVTAVRFDGVDQPSFRDPNLAHRPLTALGRIEAESLDTSTLLQNTVVVAVDGLAVLAGGSRRVAEAFRGADMTGANAELAKLVDAVRSLMTLTGAIAGAAGVDLQAVPCGTTTGEHAIARVADALTTLVAWQQTHDAVAVADGLEYELAPALVGWRDVLDGIGLRCCA